MKQASWTTFKDGEIQGKTRGPRLASEDIRTTTGDPMLTSAAFDPERRRPDVTLLSWTRTGHPLTDLDVARVQRATP